MPAEVMRVVPVQLSAAGKASPLLEIFRTRAGRFTRCVEAASDSCFANQAGRPLAAQAHGGLRWQLHCQAVKAILAKPDLMSGAIV